MESKTAFSPSHITGLFTIVENKDPKKTGSLGAGVCLSDGVHTTIKASKASRWNVHVGMNGHTAIFKTTEAVVEEFKRLTPQPYTISITHRTEVPLASGYGISGAMALSTALALNSTFNLGLATIEAAQIAHIAEVRCRTGLGTVAAETYGGIEIREKPGAPGIGSVKKINASNMKVLSLCLGPLPTKRFLINRRFKEYATGIGMEHMKKLVANPTLPNFLRLSRIFADRLNIYPESLRKILNRFDGGKPGFTMNMFGESIFTIVGVDEIENTIQLLRESRPPHSRIIISEIDWKGARLVE